MEIKLERELRQQKITNGVFKAYLRIAKLLSNRTRWRILAELEKKGTLTWPQMEHEMDINPNMIRHHVGKLLDAKLVQKTNPGYRLTRAGKAVLTMSLEEMMKMAEIGIEVATTKKKEVEK